MPRAMPKGVSRRMPSTTETIRELAADKNTLLSLLPTKRIVPTTTTKNGEHYRILGDVLALVVPPSVKKTTHVAPQKP